LEFGLTLIRVKGLTTTGDEAHAGRVEINGPEDVGLIGAGTVHDLEAKVVVHLDAGFHGRTARLRASQVVNASPAGVGLDALLRQIAIPTSFERRGGSRQAILAIEPDVGNITVTGLVAAEAAFSGLIGEAGVVISGGIVVGILGFDYDGGEGGFNVCRATEIALDEHGQERGLDGLAELLNLFELFF